jgi:hypothetical protein
MTKEIQPGPKPSDLYYNRATALGYLEDYNDAVQNYKKAAEMDACLETKNQIETIYERVKSVYNAI